jgi:hypothetical protein
MTALLVIAYALAILATVADIETTVYGLSLPLKPGTFVIESSTAVYGTHPSRLKLYAVGVPIAVGLIALSVLLDKIHWGYAAYALLIPLIAIRGYAAIKNFRMNRKLQAHA